jgi:hypothetical protein
VVLLHCWGAEISHLLRAVDFSVSQRFDLLDAAVNMAEEMVEARERRLAKEAMLKLAEQSE